MRPRTEILVALGVFVLAMLLAFGAAREEGANLSTDPSSSSLSTGPNGTMAFAEVIERAGGTATRTRVRITELDSTTLEGATLAVINPAQSLSENEVETLFSLPASGTNVLLAGPNTADLLRCLGLRIHFAILDSSRVVGPSGVERRGVTTTFTRDSLFRPRRDAFGDDQECPAIALASTDTILRAKSGQGVLLRLHLQGSDGVMLLLSDASLIGTTAFAADELPEVIVGALLAASRKVIFDEYHHLGPQGSMLRAAVAWTRRSPWGWSIWQLGFVGLLAFLAGAWRFGPIRAAIGRQRRSPLEHVRALATALAASNGHDVAIGALVRGLQRRLASSGAEARRGGRVARGAWVPFVERLATRSPDPRARERAAHLAAFARPGQPDTAVREAANAVEDVWDALHR
jgi:hypothetical protein